MRAARWLAVAALAAAAVGGCADDAPSPDDATRGGSLVVAEADVPDSLDPAVADTDAARRLLWLTHVPPLTYRRAEGEEGTVLIPGLARELPEASDDGRTYTFTFRRGLRYSDGTPLRASHFERAVVRALRLNPAAAEALGGIVGAGEAAATEGPDPDVEGIVADDPARTVTIELETPDRLFPYALAAQWAAPVPGRTPLREMSASPPRGIGPYRVAQLRRRGEVLLARRKAWRLSGVPAGHADEIATRTMPDRRQRSAAVLSRSADLAVGEPPLDTLAELRADGGRGSYAERPTLRSLYVAIDASSAPFRDIDVRRALSYALDVGRLARLYNGFMRPSCNMLPPGVPGYRQLDPCPYGPRSDNADLVEASRLVQDAEATGATVYVAAGPGRRGRALTRYLVATLRKLGLFARVAPAPRLAQVRFAVAAPALPHPVGYFAAADDPALLAEVALLTQQAPPRESAQEWAEVDAEMVERAYAAPYGVETVGVLASDRIDMENCGRYHPVVGLDYASVCLR